MTPAEARSLILTQHAGLRALLETAVRLARLHVAGAVIEDELEAVVAAIRVAFAEHNLFETRLLVPMLGGVDAWGPKRIERMLTEHLEEHRVIEAFLARPARDVVPDLADFVEEIDAHMLAEERTFLSPHALPER